MASSEAQAGAIAAPRCAVGADAFPASRIDPALGGEALAVICEEASPDGSKSITEYACLRASAYYLVRAEISQTDRELALQRCGLRSAVAVRRHAIKTFVEKPR